MRTWDVDLPIRLEAFRHLRELVAAHGSVLRWEELAEGFEYHGERVLIANRARGIFRPAAMTGGALSIKTTVPRAGREARYDDQVASKAGHFVYKLQGNDPGARDNLWLHEAYQAGAPLVYLYGVAPGLYRPLWPAFVVGWDHQNLECRVSVDTEDAVSAYPELEASEFAGDLPRHSDDLGDEVAIRRRYVTVEAKRRLHQDKFRAQVLRAYRTRCAMCGLPRQELLDAAHILPDRDERGRPEVPNGLALCHLHHRAYDRYVVGIRPDYVVEVAPRVMHDHDGPVLEHAIKGIHGRTILVPRSAGQRPRPENLEERYEAFVRSG